MDADSSYPIPEVVEQLPPKLWVSMEIGPVHPELGTPCWLWTGRLNRNGYGRVYIDGHEPVAHRAVYERLIGPIPPKHILDHKCKVHHCVNPDHLEPVTHKINTERGNAVLFKRPEEYAIPAEANEASEERGRTDVRRSDGDRSHRAESDGTSEHDTHLRWGDAGVEGCAVKACSGDIRSEAASLADVIEQAQSKFYGDARDEYVRYDAWRSFFVHIFAGLDKIFSIFFWTFVIAWIAATVWINL